MLWHRYLFRFCNDATVRLISERPGGGAWVPCCLRLPRLQRWSIRRLAATVARLDPTLTPVLAKETLRFSLEGPILHCRLWLPSGGWYRIAFDLEYVGGATRQVIVGPIGIGELYVIAGQSYVTNSHDELRTIQDVTGRVVAFDGQSEAWRVAYDPQPIAAARRARSEVMQWEKLARFLCRDPGRMFCAGSIWPVAMSHLLREVDVPIGMLNVASGNTTLEDWQPGKPLWTDLVEALKQAGDVRAILWQQGESDVLAGTNEETFVGRFNALRSEVASQLAFKPIWIVAKSTQHPSIYRLPEREAVIRRAIDGIWLENNVLPGPDSDLIGVDMRSSKRLSGHLTGDGQDRLGELWAKSLLGQLRASNARLSHPDIERAG